MRRSPSRRTGTTGLLPMYPMIPHIPSVLRLAFPAFHPPGDICLPPAGNTQRAVGHVLGDRRPGAHVGALADADRRDQLTVTADERAVLDDRRVLLRPVVVARDGPGADIH